MRIWPFGLECDGIALFASDLKSEPIIGDLAEAQSQFPKAVPSRHVEFAAGRACAAAALRALGGGGEVSIAHSHRYPLFPASFVGSISHTQSEAVACAGRTAVYRSIGIDIEPIKSHEDLATLAPAVMSKGELEIFSTMSAVEALVFFHVCFSLKEALFKALYPLTHCWLDFQEAEVAHLPARGEVDVRLVGARAQAFSTLEASLSCECAVYGPNVITLVTIER